VQRAVWRLCRKAGHSLSINWPLLPSGVFTAALWTLPDGHDAATVVPRCADVTRLSSQSVRRQGNERQRDRRGYYSRDDQPEPPTQALNEVVVEPWKGGATLDARSCTPKRDAATWTVAIV
jgi:hypothetical protein